MNINCLLLIGLCLIAISATTGADNPLSFFREEWAKFKAAHNRRYSSLVEHAHRFGVYVENLKHVLQHNRDFKLGKHSFDIHINLFGDRTQQEIVHQMNGFNQTLHEAALAAEEQLEVEAPHHGRRVARSVGQPLPAEVDWRKKGAVGPVVDQGQCGSCWAFSTAGAFESHYFIKYGRLPTLSQQQLVDCSLQNNGCHGGIMQYAMQYVSDVGGMVSSAAYPYVTEQRSCTLRKSDVLRMGAGYRRLPYGSEEALKEAVANIGPVAISIDASQRSFSFYRGGIYYEPACTPEFHDHAVLVVGYGTDAATGADYWLVKNSWGRSWGENGYIRMARNRNNNCSVGGNCVYPIA